MKHSLLDWTDTNCLPPRGPWLEVMLAAEVLRGFEELGTVPAAERDRVLGIERR